MEQEIGRLLTQLNQVYAQIDMNVEERGRIVSVQSLEKVGVIVSDSRDVQESLLAFVKRRQTIQEELYNEWLQKYVIELNKWKSARLDELQKDMEVCQREIMAHSQRLIDSVNTDANWLRDKILEEEQSYASKMAREIITRIQTMSIDYLDIETINEINLIIHGNVSMKASDQNRKVNSDDFYDPSDQMRTDMIDEHNHAQNNQQYVEDF